MALSRRSSSLVDLVGHDTSGTEAHRSGGSDMAMSCGVGFELDGELYSCLHLHSAGEEPLLYFKRDTDYEGLRRPSFLFPLPSVTPSSSSPGTVKEHHLLGSAHLPNTRSWSSQSISENDLQGCRPESAQW